MSRTRRRDLAKTRITNILSRYTVALARTLENKIADAGPNNQRIQPHIITEAKQQLEDDGLLCSLRRDNARWYYLPNATPADVDARLTQLRPIHKALSRRQFTTRAGQALEIAVFRALWTQHELPFLGNFPDLDAHGDDALYSKDEPPSAISGNRIPGHQKLDFIAGDLATPAGIEVKNVREWIYPNRKEVIDLIRKCCHLNAVPVLIARRWPYVTYSVLTTCGVILHQTYNQRFPAADAELAAQAKHKNLLGFHDIRLGNEPDVRLIRFVHEHLPNLIPAAREKFDRYRDLLTDYAEGEMLYKEFAARVKRRMRGEPEDLPPFAPD